MLSRLAERRREPEVMDRPGLDPQLHAQALRGLARINRVSRTDAVFWPRIMALTGEKPGRRLRVLDVATGGGDLPIRLWHRARRAGVSIDITGTDVSATALDYARRNARANGADVGFLRSDLVRDEVPGGFDVITSSLFLHHLSDDDAVEALRKMARAAGSLLLVDDLRRCAVGYLLARVATRVLSRSPVVHVDGPRSVEAAFTVAEAHALAERAGVGGVTIERHWPCRFLLSWRRPA